MKKSKKWMLSVLLCGFLVSMISCGTTEGAKDADTIGTADMTEAKTDGGSELPDEGNDKVFEDIENAEEITQEDFLVVIDAGHQRRGNSEKEPVGPGSTEMKAKVTGGTTGVSTGLAEYELNLQVALKLEAELIERGYTVIMVRTEHDVDISNSERAAVANEAGADAFIRIHANGSENSTVNGAMTICQCI